MLFMLHCIPRQGPYTSFISQISRQILYSGVEAFWLVGIIAFLAGCTIVIQATTTMPDLRNRVFW